MDDKFIPIYTTKGDLGAFLLYPYLFNPQGEWIGFVTPKKEVYSVLGQYVGYLGDGPRVLRQRTYNFDKPALKPPEPPPFIFQLPPSAPLPPMMSELTVSVIDILEEEPDRLLPLNASENLRDLD